MTADPSSPQPDSHSLIRQHHGTPPTPLLGRDWEIDQVMTFLDRDDIRVVTLLGPGGVGKTRLAHQVMEMARPSFAHGAHFVSLESIRDADQVPGSVARSLGLQDNAGRSAASLLADRLAERHMLLVLDNLEQVIGAAHPWLSGLLSRAPLLKVLVTSRAPLNIDGEQQFTLSPLATPLHDDDPSPAVALFVQRAQVIDPSFALDEENRAAVATICRRLDGLPLAIELAASWLRTFPPRALLSQLTNRLAILAGGHRDAPPRLRSMRDAIGWSYDLLSPEEQWLYRQLSVFVGGFSLDAAAFVAACGHSPHDGVDVTDVLHSLIDQSLLQAIHDAPVPRFRMLETIREYGLQALAAHDERDIACAVHADYIRSLAQGSWNALMGPDEAHVLQRLEAEYANILAAVEWLDSQARPADAIEIHAAVQFFLDLRGHTVESLERLDAWLERPALKGRSRTRGLALLTAGGLRQNTGDYTRSAEMLGEAFEILSETGDQHFAALAIGIRGATFWMAGDPEQMRDAVELSITLARPLHLHRTVSAGLSFLAMYAEMHDDPERARILRQESREIALSNGDVWLQAFHLAYDSTDALRAGDLETAERSLMQSRDLFEALGSSRDLPGIWAGLASIARRRGDYELAKTRMSTGLAVAEASGHTAYANDLALGACVIDAEAGHLDEAFRTFAGILTNIKQHGEMVDLCQCLATAATLASLAGSAVPATRLLGACARMVHDAGISESHTDILEDAFGHREELRRTLGESTFSHSWSDGVRLTTEAAVKEALAYKPPTTPTEKAPDATPSGTITPREREVLQYMAAGLTNQEIADTLSLSVRTITSHVTSILAKLDVSSRTAAVSFAIRHGMA